MEESVRSHRAQLQKTHTEFRSRWATANSEKQTLQTTISDLRSEIEVLTTNLNGQLEVLRLEKSALENSLALEKASKPSSSTVESDASVVRSARVSFNFALVLNIYTAQVSLREERDKLLAEKDSWITSGAVGDTIFAATTDEARLAWETEKAELLKAREHAASQAKV